MSENNTKSNDQHRNVEKCKPPSKTTGQSAETAAHNKRKAGDRQTTIKWQLKEENKRNHAQSAQTAA